MFLDSIKYSLCTSIVLLHHIWIQMLSEKALGPPNQIPDTSSEITWIHRAIGYVYCIYIYQWKWLELAVQSRPISRIFACHKAPHNHEWICINRLDILFFLKVQTKKKAPWLSSCQMLGTRWCRCPVHPRLIFTMAAGTKVLTDSTRNKYHIHNIIYNIYIIEINDDPLEILLSAERQDRLKRPWLKLWIQWVLC
jgi:hypothetical protein